MTLGQIVPDCSRYVGRGERKHRPQRCDQAEGAGRGGCVAGGDWRAAERGRGLAAVPSWGDLGGHHTQEGEGREESPGRRECGQARKEGGGCAGPKDGPLV